jgi:hypothetical protein
MQGRGEHGSLFSAGSENFSAREGEGPHFSSDPNGAKAESQVVNHRAVGNGLGEEERAELTLREALSPM